MRKCSGCPWEWLQGIKKETLRLFFFYPKTFWRLSLKKKKKRKSLLEGIFVPQKSSPLGCVGHMLFVHLHQLCNTLYHECWTHSLLLNFLSCLLRDILRECGGCCTAPFPSFEISA